MRTLTAWVVLAVLNSACGLSPGNPPTAPAAAAGELIQDASIFGTVRTLIGGARSRVDVEMYEFGRIDLADLLVAAHARGTGVRVLLDPTVAQDRPVAVRLQAGAVEVRWYPVDDHRGQIDHVKLLLADGSALVGGMNWGGHSAANHDYALADSEPSDLGRLAAIFEQDWSLAGGRPAALGSTSGPVAQTSPGEEIRARLQAAIVAARASISAEVFALTDADVIAALADAHRRGVDVRVLLDPGESVNRPTFRLLRQAGVSTAWYPAAPGSKLHAKIGAFDGMLMLGSANWSRHGLSVNHELDVATERRGPLAAYRARFEKDWEAAARTENGMGASALSAANGSSSASSCACACASSCAAS